MSRMWMPRLAIAALAAAASVGIPQLAGAQTISTAPSDLAENFWPDLVDYGTQLPPIGATAEQATITVPAVAPGAQTTYAWIMVDAGGVQWTQVGIAWFANSQPYIFADSGVRYPTANTRYTIGPSVTPGASVTVRIAQNGNLWADEYSTGAGWDELDSYPLPAAYFDPPTVETYGQAVPGTWLFRGVGYANSTVWHHMASTGIGTGQPVMGSAIL